VTSLTAGFAAGTEPLVLSPENTVLLEGPGASAATLQYYLLRYYVGAETAERYQAGAALDRAAAAQFPVVRQNRDPLPEGETIIALGNTRFLSGDDRRRLEQHPGAVLLRRQDEVLVVAGELSEATSEFLNRVAGIRCYAPDEIWTSRPARNKMSVTTLDLFRPRVFATSWLAPYWKRNAEWVRMNPTAGRLTISSNHNLANIFPPEKYAQSHPEIYEMWAGERRVPANLGTRIWNPCLTAKALPDLAMEYIRDVKKSRPGTAYVSMGMMDINFDCECPACQESVRKRQNCHARRNGGQSSLGSNRHWRCRKTPRRSCWFPTGHSPSSTLITTDMGKLRDACYFSRHS
jgi:hypothetical protein